MKRVPISEAKAELSQWIDWVKAGETVLITDRDIPVAKLESVQNHAGGEAHGRVERLLRAGIAKPPEKSLSQDWLKRHPLIDVSAEVDTGKIIREERDSGW